MGRQEFTRASLLGVREKLANNLGTLVDRLDCPFYEDAAVIMSGSQTDRVRHISISPRRSMTERLKPRPPSAATKSPPARKQFAPTKLLKAPIKPQELTLV